MLSIRRTGVSPVRGYDAGFPACTREIFAYIGMHPKNEAALACQNP